MCVAIAIAVGLAQILGGTTGTSAEARATCSEIKSSIVDSLTPLSYLALLRQVAHDGQHSGNAAISVAAEILAASLPPTNTRNAYSAVNWGEANTARGELIAACDALGIGPYVSPPHASSRGDTGPSSIGRRRLAAEQRCTLPRGQNRPLTTRYHSHSD